MIVGAIIGILIAALFASIIIWIVGKLGLGLEVDGWVSAFIAGIAIAIISGLITWLLGAVGITIGGGILGAIIHLIIAAVVIYLAGSFVSGLKVKGFSGALIAAIAIGVVGWLANFVVGLFS
jgi:putative membrane protein